MFLLFELELWVKSQRIPLSPTNIDLPWIISLDIFCTGIILHACPQIVYCNCVSSVTVYQFKNQDRQTDRQGDSYIHPKTLFAGSTKKHWDRYCLYKLINYIYLFGWCKESKRYPVLCPSSLLTEINVSCYTEVHISLVIILVLFISWIVYTRYKQGCFYKWFSHHFNALILISRLLQAHKKLDLLQWF